MIYPMRNCPLGTSWSARSKRGVARVFLDTNVFLYAVGAEGPHRQSCRDVLVAVGEGRIEGLTSSEVLQEILHVRSRRLGQPDAMAAVQAAAALVADVLPVSRADVLFACDVLDRHPRLNARDAIHLAVMAGAELDTIVSVDTHFDGLVGVRRLDPSQVQSVHR
ncbi:MAG: type II toxin-antitoxin system VapC family toxin [Ardenticatenales bacterium]